MDITAKDQLVGITGLSYSNSAALNYKHSFISYHQEVYEHQAQAT
jgi:hypothetical protein